VDSGNASKAIFQKLIIIWGRPLSRPPIANSGAPLPKQALVWLAVCLCTVALCTIVCHALFGRPYLDEVRWDSFVAQLGTTELKICWEFMLPVRPIRPTSGAHPARGSHATTPTHEGPK
jgi:hypothetical protein